MPNAILKQGHKGSPLCLFIHGLGMDRNIWVEPVKARILFRFPLPVLLSKPPTAKKVTVKLTDHITTGAPPRILKTSFHDLEKEGYSVMAYSQRRPASDCMNLIEELAEVLNRYHYLSIDGVIFITHSRGGLIARKAIELLNIQCIALITLSTPHHGSSLAKLADSLSGFSKILYPFFEDAERGTVRGTMKRLIEFLKSDAIAEVLPGSPFMKCLDDNSLRAIKTISFGGTDPTLFTLYRLHKGSRKYKKLFSIQEILTSFVPEGILPEELIMGKGDGLVSAESSVAPHAVEHYNFPLNHAQILFDSSVREIVKSFVKVVS